MINLEKYIALAKSAKDYANENNDIIIRFPNVAKAHINGLADMVLRLSVEIQNNELDKMQKITESEYK